MPRKLALRIRRGGLALGRVAVTSTLRALGWSVGVALAFTAIAIISAPGPRKWSFIERGASGPALGLAVPHPDAGAWTIEGQREATGGAALVSGSGDAALRHSLAIATAAPFQHGRVRTRCRPMLPGGEGCGVAFAYEDAQHFHLVRANRVTQALELVRVSGASLDVLAAHPVEIDTEGWHSVGVDVSSAHVRLLWDGAELGEVELPRRLGRVGLWAPSLGETAFDHLEITPADEAPDPLALLVVLGGRRR